MHPGRQRGFTLLEAIVALVLISGAGASLFAWINTSLNSLYRIQETNTRVEATRNVLTFMHAVNPMQAPEGTSELGAYRVRWKAEITHPPQDGANYPQGISLYQLALYRTRVMVERQDGEYWFDLALKQVGYKKVRELQRPF